MITFIYDNGGKEPIEVVAKNVHDANIRLSKLKVDKSPCLVGFYEGAIPELHFTKADKLATKHEHHKPLILSHKNYLPKANSIFKYWKA